MRLSAFISSLLALTSIVSGSPTPQIYDASGSITALSGTLNTSGTQIVGNYYNYWNVQNHSTATTEDVIYDLTRSDRLPTTTPVLLHNVFAGSRKSALIEPSRTGLFIVDMQNFFLHPKLSPAASKGRAAVKPTLNMIDGFRKMGGTVFWTNWGLDNFDLVTIPPSFLEGFASDPSNAQGSSFGSDMGSLTMENGTVVQVGRKLMRGAWNAQPWGDLYPAMMKGLEAGTDFHFNKNRLSGLWGAQTPLGLYLQEHEITTLVMGGVNSDQCVFSTFIDAYFKGFDVIFVDDIAATVSPEYARQMVLYNADLDGFIGNSTEILAAIDKTYS